MNLETNLCTINSRKLDNSIHKQWQAKLIERQDNLLIFFGEFEKEIKHPQIGVIRRATTSFEFYWLDRGYNVFRFHEPEGGLRNFYCNLNQPPIFENNILDYVDLDLDVLVWKDFSLEILDSEEFEKNSRKYNYTESLRAEVDKNLKELLFLIKQKSFPFDYKL
jgi:protein associated with RNAse G/E